MREETAPSEEPIEEELHVDFEVEGVGLGISCACLVLLCSWEPFER